jgi:endo-alpha-1,4-polygalactosaminidase (GH114 family)
VTNEERERLLQLCELAAREQDPQRLLIMVQEINTLLETKQERLKQRDAAGTKPPA